MELYFLGTNAGVPTLQRNVTSIGLRMLDERRALWLFDCGEGTQHQILRSPLKLSKLEKIFITHLHGDHVFGLPGLLSSRAYQGGTTPLTVYGPPGTERMIVTTLELSQSRLNYELNIVEHTGGIVFEDDSFIVESALLEHRIDSYGYRITEMITLDSGETVRPEDVLGAPKRGMVITILGDTRPCDSVVPLAQDADVLIHEATFMHDLVDTAHEYYHSTSKQAAEAARAANVGLLIMTHFSSRYKDEEQLEPLLEEAKSIFPNTRLADEHQLIPVIHGKYKTSQ